MSDKQPAPATAFAMAERQRDISVSEFFLKNRHLLGFDKPAKALLTTVKEAVDNSLDACEEAGILPEISVQVIDCVRQVPRRRRGQRAGHRGKPDRPDLRQAALRLEVPQAQPVARPAGHRHRGRRHVRAAHDRQADTHHEPRQGPAPGVGDVRVDRRRQEPTGHSPQEAAGMGPPARHDASRSSSRATIRRGRIRSKRI